VPARRPAAGRVIFRPPVVRQVVPAWCAHHPDFVNITVDLM
jgi:hypothetical protein